MSHALHALLSGKGLADLYDLFAGEDIEASMVPDLSDRDLRELGLSLGQRKKFAAAFREPSASEPRRARIPAERRQLTVVFCDLVGSTRLSTVLDPEDLREVITAYLDTAVATLRSHGGYHAYTQGDGLMVYFGYPNAQEDDPVRAIRAALATISAVQNLKTRAPWPLNVRLGVATGKVVVGDLAVDSVAPQDFVVGETPNLASRMQGLAAPGEVIVAGETQRLASGAFEFDPRGAVEVKGFAERHPIFAIKSEITGKSRFETRTVDGVQRIVGREKELDKLSGLWAKTKSGAGRICLIQGPPGIGKSRLVRGVYPLAGRPAVEWQCAPHLTNSALHPMIAELEREAGIRPGDTADERRAKAGAFVERAKYLADSDLPLVAGIVGAPLEDAVQLDAQVRARLTQDMFLRRLNGAADGPALVVLEDMHWADPTTLEFLDLLVTKIAELPVLLLITYRPEFEPTADLKAAADHLGLEPLPADAGFELVRNIAGERPVSSVLARRIIEKTDGVPLFVEELTKAILDAIPENGQITADTLDMLEIPATLQDSLMSRLDRTGPAKEVAQLGAVIGREFTATMVSVIASDGVDVKGALQSLESAELLHRGGLMGDDYFVFNHALIQDTAYESMLRSTRRAIHQALALAMLDQHPAFGVQEPEAIARHCENGGMDAEAIEQWTKAGYDAMGRAANLAALSHFSAALRLLDRQPEGPEREATELGLQMALMAVSMSIYGWGSPKVEQAAFRSRDLARGLNQGEALFGATWGIWTMHFLRGELGQGIEVAVEVDGMAQAVGAPLLLTAADHAVSYTQYYRGELKEAYDRYQLGMTRFDPAADAEIMRTFQLSSALAMMDAGSAAAWVMGREEEARVASQRFVDYLEQLDHPPSYAYGLGALGHLAMIARDWERMSEVARKNKTMSADLGYLMWEKVADLQLVVSQAYLDGKLAENADATLKAQKAFVNSGTSLTELLSVPPVVEMLIAAGRANEALALVETRIARSLDLFERVNLSDLYRARGLAHQAAGNRASALGDLKIAHDTAEAQGAVRLMERADAHLRELVG